MPSYRISVDVELDADDKAKAEIAVTKALEPVVDEIDVISTEQIDEVDADEDEDEGDENN